MEKLKEIIEFIKEHKKAFAFGAVVVVCIIAGAVIF